MLTPWLRCRRWGACQPESVLRVSQPHLRQNDERGEGETAAPRALIPAGFPLLPDFRSLLAKCCSCSTGGCAPLEPGRGGEERWWEARRGSDTPLAPEPCWCSPGRSGCVTGCPAAEQLTSAGSPMHTPGTPCLSPGIAAWPARQQMFKARVIPAVLCSCGRSYSSFRLRGVM